MNRSRKHNPARSAGFTLAELVVAIGLVTLLMLGIGRLFSTVTRLTGTGTSVAETDALARVLENLLRADFEGFNRLREDQVFFQIRNRRIGGNLNGNTRRNPDASEGEFPLFLNADDQLADERRGLGPYENRNAGAVSRAVTVRLDEMVFVTLGGVNGSVTSFQQDNLGRTPVGAIHALVSYGHGLKRALDPNFDPTDPDSFPIPVWRADGEADYNFSDAYGAIGSRNEFAGGFSLMRQQMLLFGGLAAGYPVGSGREAPIGNEREYTPYARDFGSASYFNGLGRNFFIDPDEPSGSAGFPNDGELPNPRARWMGRTDIIAQDLATFQRWMEGEEDLPVEGNQYRMNVDYPEFIGDPNSPFNFIPADATAFDTGSLDVNRRFLQSGDPDYRLYRRFAGHDSPSGALPTRISAYYRNITNLQSALAGTFCRPLYEPEPFPARRTDPMGNSDPSESRMDISALLAERCSSFEVAWSDGSTWLFDETARVDTDGIYDSEDENSLERVLKRGDLIWFDMDFTRQDLWNVISGNTRSAMQAPGVRPFVAPNSAFSSTEDEFSPRSIELARQFYPQDRAAPEIGDRNGTPSTLPLFYTDASGNRVPIPNTAGREARLNGFRSVFDGTWPPTPNNEFAAYSAQLTGGALPDLGDEYMAIFPFRKPNGHDERLDVGGLLDDGYDGVWPKPEFVRIRATLHDAQFRIQGGRTYEFIFRLSPIRAD